MFLNETYFWAFKLNSTLRISDYALSTDTKGHTQCWKLPHIVGSGREFLGSLHPAYFVRRLIPTQDLQDKSGETTAGPGLPLQ